MSMQPLLPATPEDLVTAQHRGKEPPMMQPNLIAATPDDLVAAQLRLAAAKDADDQAIADKRTATANATAAKKELRGALVGWRTVLRQMGLMLDNGFLTAAGDDDAGPEGVPGLDTDLEDPDAPDANEAQPDDFDQLREHTAESVTPGRRRR